MNLRRILIGTALLALVFGVEFGLERVIPDAAWRAATLFAMVNIVVALSLNVINGMAGQFSIGHAGFVGIGAYTGAIVAATLHQKLGGGDALFKNSFLVMPLAIVASGAVAAIFGFVVGLPSLRLKGDYLAIVTLGFSEIIRLLISTAQVGGDQLSGFAGMIAKLGGQNGYAGPDNTGLPQYAGPFWIFGMVVLLTIVAWRIKFSGWGRTLRALREDEIASAAVGVDPTRYKVASFVLAAMGAGIAGALLSSMRDGNPTVQPDQFNFNYSFDAITMVILGGSGSISGAIVGGLFVTFTVKIIEQLQRLESIQDLLIKNPWLDLNAVRMLIYAAVLIGLMILRPEGLFGEREIVGQASRKKRAEGAA